MKDISTKLTLALLVIMLNSGCTNVFAGNVTKANKQGFTSGTSYTWYDGDRTRTIWLNPNLIAEFNHGAGNNTANSPLASSATPLPGKRSSMRLWRLKTGQTSKSQMQQLQRSSLNTKVSPVLHDGPSESGRKRALPGNIIVHLDPKWTAQQVSGWLKENSLEVVRPLNIGPNIFVIKTGPGLEALEKANAIYQSGNVVAAYPDWWQEVVRR